MTASTRPDDATDDRVAVAAGVRGRQRPRNAVVAPVGHDEAADLVERCVRRDDADRRVLDRERFCTEDVGWRRRPIRLAAIVDVSHCVHGDEGAHDEVAVAHGRAAEPPRTGVLPAAPLPDGRAGAGADATDLHRTASRLGAGCVALDRPRPHVWLADEKVEERHRDDDRHRTGAGREPRALLGAPAHHTVGRGEPERGAAGQQHGVEPIDHALGREQIELPRRGRAAAHLARMHACLRGTGSPCIRSAPRGASSDRHAPLECR